MHSNSQPKISTATYLQYRRRVATAYKVSGIIPDGLPNILDISVLDDFSELREILRFGSFKIAGLLLGDDERRHGIGQRVHQDGLEAVPRELLRLLECLEGFQPAFLVLFDDFQRLELVPVDVQRLRLYRI